MCIYIYIRTHVSGGVKLYGNSRRLDAHTCNKKLFNRFLFFVHFIIICTRLRRETSYGVVSVPAFAFYNTTCSCTNEYTPHARVIHHVYHYCTPDTCMLYYYWRFIAASCKYTRTNTKCVYTYYTDTRALLILDCLAAAGSESTFGRHLNHLRK